VNGKDSKKDDGDQMPETVSGGERNAEIAAHELRRDVLARLATTNLVQATNSIAAAADQASTAAHDRAMQGLQQEFGAFRQREMEAHEEFARAVDKELAPEPFLAAQRVYSGELLKLWVEEHKTFAKSNIELAGRRNEIYSQAVARFVEEVERYENQLEKLLSEGGGVGPLGDWVGPFGGMGGPGGGFGPGGGGFGPPGGMGGPGGGFGPGGGGFGPPGGMGGPSGGPGYDPRIAGGPGGPGGPGAQG
jgi:hypothetical protein